MTTLPDPIGREIRKELDRFGPAGRMGEIVAAWPGAVGPAIAANAWPARVGRDGTLHVTTGSSAWAFELTQLSGTILDRLREHLGEGCPGELRFTVGPLPEAGAERENESQRTVPKPTAAHSREADRLAASIGDPELRGAVSRAAAASLAAGSSRPDDRPV